MISGEPFIFNNKIKKNLINGIFTQCFEEWRYKKIVFKTPKDVMRKFNKMWYPGIKKMESYAVVIPIWQK